MYGFINQMVFTSIKYDPFLVDIKLCITFVQLFEDNLQAQILTARNLEQMLPAYATPNTNEIHLYDINPFSMSV